MGRPKGKKKQDEEQLNTALNQKSAEKTVNGNESPTVDEDIPIPSQEHCTWLLNIIRLHATEISTEQLREFENSKVHQLQQQVEKLMNELRTMMTAVEEVDFLKSENIKKQKKIERLEYQNSRRQSEIQELKMKVDDLQQKELDHCIQIVGLPEATDEAEDVKKITKLVKDKLGVKIKSTDVEMHRLGKKKSGKSRNTIIRLKDKQTRDNIYNQRKKLIKPGNPTGSIYLNDTLTVHRQQLLYAARKLVKARKIFAAWSQQGNILVKKAENSKIIQVRDNINLTELRLDETEHHMEDGKSQGLPSSITSEITHLSDYEYYIDSD